jgi:hypothetical protein
MVAYPLSSSSDRPTIEAWHHGKIYARALEFSKAKIKVFLVGKKECN